MPTDAALLSHFASTRSEEAFADLVRRYLPLVYSSALRRLDGDAHRAEDVAQVVFTALARDATRLSRHPALTGWLYTTTRNAAIDVVRVEKRRRRREQEAQIMEEISKPHRDRTTWEHLKPVLDGVMDQLSSQDREAVLLRFFQGQPFAEIGRALGTSEEAARKRVDRALDKLGHLLRRRGIVSTATALGTLLVAETASAVPAGLTASIASTALAGSTSVASVVTFMTLTKLQAGIAAAVIVGGTVGIITQQRQLTGLHNTNAVLRQQLSTRTEENTALAKARTATEAEAAKLRAEIVALQSGTNIASVPADNPGGALPPRGGRASDGPKPAAATTANLQEKTRLHRRYDPFLLQQCGLTPAQADRFVELKIQQAEARHDLQSSVEEVGLRGDTSGVETLRSKLYAPIEQELRELLGGAGYAAYGEYEFTSYYREAFVNRLTPLFSAANVPLSADQAHLLVRIISANDHPTKLKPTDIGTESGIDWESVLVQTGDLLSPAQKAVLRTYVNRQSKDK